MKVSEADYKELLGMLCPYCKHEIPDHFNSTREVWVHTLPHTIIQGETCGAARVRGKLDVGPNV